MESASRLEGAAAETTVYQDHGMTKKKKMHEAGIQQLSLGPQPR